LAGTVNPAAVAKYQTIKAFIDMSRMDVSRYYLTFADCCPASTTFSGRRQLFFPTVLPQGVLIVADH
jgi:hypothetical protein